MSYKTYRNQRNQLAIFKVANALGVAALDLATVISFETGGTFNPHKKGGDGGNYWGLIQFGPEERRVYGYHPDQKFHEQVYGPVYNFLEGRKLKKWIEDNPNASLMDIRTALYSTINAGSPHRKYWVRRDSRGDTVAEKAQEMFKPGKPGQTHAGNALAFLS